MSECLECLGGRAFVLLSFVGGSTCIHGLAMGIRLLGVGPACIGGGVGTGPSVPRVGVAVPFHRGSVLLVYNQVG